MISGRAAAYILYTCGMAITHQCEYHLTLNPWTGAGCSLRLCTLLSWILEWLPSLVSFLSQWETEGMSFLLSDLKVIKKAGDKMFQRIASSGSSCPITLMKYASLHRYFWVSSSINWDNESSPDHLTMVMFWVPGCRWSINARTSHSSNVL